MRVAAGIDIGGSGTKFGIVNEQGACTEIFRLPTKKFQSPEELVEKISSHISELLPENSRLAGIGIGAPNANFYKGVIESAPNLPWQGTVPLVKLFEKQVKVPCILTNDANAAALGEMYFGGARKMDDFIFVTLGTGLGSGIVANRQLIYGHDGLAAELGHVIVVKNGRNCGCGRKGCLETYVSVTGLKRTVKEWISEGKKSVLSKPEKIRFSDIFEAAENGDSLAMEAFEFTGEMLGLALANSVAYTSPKAIFLFGGLTKAEHLIFEPTQRHFEKNLMNIYKNKIKILPSELRKNHAPVLGAASLILNK